MEQEASRRVAAPWFSLLLATQGARITPGQLMGEEPESLEDRVSDAERDLKKLMKRMKKAGLR